MIITITEVLPMSAWFLDNELSACVILILLIKSF